MNATEREFLGEIERSAEEVLSIVHEEGFPEVNIPITLFESKKLTDKERLIKLYTNLELMKLYTKYRTFDLEACRRDLEELSSILSDLME